MIIIYSNVVSLSQVINTLTGIHQIVLFYFVFTLFIFHQWYQSKVMVEEEKEKRSLNLLSVISKTIDRQVLGLATTIAWYNHHRLIVFPKDNLFEVTVRGLRYTGDLERLEDHNNKEEKY